MDRYSGFFGMATTNPVHISVQRPRVSSAFLLHTRRVSSSTSCYYGLLKARALQVGAKGSSSFAFSPLVEGGKKKKHVVPPQVVHSGKALNSSMLFGWCQQQLRQRIPVVAALARDADDDSEIESVDGLELHTSIIMCLDYLILSYNQNFHRQLFEKSNYISQNNLSQVCL